MYTKSLQFKIILIDYQEQLPSSLQKAPEFMLHLAVLHTHFPENCLTSFQRVSFLSWRFTAPPRWLRFRLNVSASSEKSYSQCPVDNGWEGYQGGSGITRVNKHRRAPALKVRCPDIQWMPRCCFTGGLGDISRGGTVLGTFLIRVPSAC